nr:MAG TPA: hypothetical protein [Caudoviricetes sp.]
MNCYERYKEFFRDVRGENLYVTRELTEEEGH